MDKMPLTFKDRVNKRRVRFWQWRRKTWLLHKEAIINRIEKMLLSGKYPPRCYGCGADLEVWSFRCTNFHCCDHRELDWGGNMKNSMSSATCPRCGGTVTLKPFTITKLSDA